MKYRKKPVVIEAVQWTGENFREVADFIDDPQKWYIESGTDAPCSLVIETLEGNHKATAGDYIIRGIKGEIYPCKPDIFKMTYEEVAEWGTWLTSKRIFRTRSAR